jgi:hypothetical protein
LSYECYERATAGRLAIGDSDVSVGPRESAIVPEQGFAIYTRGISERDGFVDDGTCDATNYRPGIGIGFTLFQVPTDAAAMTPSPP